MNAPFLIRNPVEIRCGVGQIGQLGKTLPDRPVIVLVHPNADSVGAVEPLRQTLGERCVAVLDHADGLPTVAEAIRLCLRIWPLADQITGDDPNMRPLLLAFGGGATIDLAKAVCHRPQDRDPHALSAWIRGHAEQPAFDAIELIALPTTAGTGSEVTCWATLWDLDDQADASLRNRGVKRSLESPVGYPALAVIDPEATLTCPDSLTRDSGLDALSHALEAIWNRHANPFSDALGLASAKRILQVLPCLLEQPDSLELRTAMSEAALMAGLAFSQTRTALAHALSYPLTVEQGIPHGLACAIWLPTACALATGRNAARDELLGSIFTCSGEPAAALGQWLTRLGVPPPESIMTVTEIDSRIAAALAHPRGRNFIGAH